MECRYCHGRCIKKGHYKDACLYKCKSCSKCQRSIYKNQHYDSGSDLKIMALTKEGMGVRSISRYTGIPKTTVKRRVEILSARINSPEVKESGQVYEVDELYTFVGKKSRPCYIMYAINRKTRQVIDFVCGARNTENIEKIIYSLLALAPKRIYTDKLNIFASVIPEKLHRTFQYRTNRIERKNLTLRTHLKRLSRKTICFSRSVVMLAACFKLYAWG